MLTNSKDITVLKIGKKLQRLSMILCRIFAIIFVIKIVAYRLQLSINRFIVND